MNREKLVAIVTGVISVGLAIAYLVLVQLLDLRGEMLPAPLESLGLLLRGQWSGWHSLADIVKLIS